MKYATTDKYTHLAPPVLPTAIDPLDAGEEDEDSATMTLLTAPDAARSARART